MIGYFHGLKLNKTIVIYIYTIFLTKWKLIILYTKILNVISKKKYLCQFYRYRKILKKQNDQFKQSKMIRYYHTTFVQTCW